MRDNLLVLDNDGIFYSKFMKCYETEQLSAYAVRNEICAAIDRLKLAGATPAEREEMRLYFEERYNLKPSNVFSDRSPTNRLGELTKPSPPPSTPAPALKEHPAMSTIITLTTKHYINGTEVSTLSNAQIFKLIADQEAAIKDLEAITNKPNSLTKEIADRKAGVQTLVDFLNDRDAKAQA